MKFACPHCDQNLECEDRFAGMAIQCPACGEPIELPDSDNPDSTEAPPDQTMTITHSPRADVTISQYMRDRQIDGGIDLNGEDGSTSASQVLQADSGRKYNLGDEISRGGMGAILDAKDVNIRRSVAMKVMLKPSQASEGRDPALY